jgi:hypothetical protein
MKRCEVPLIKEVTRYSIMVGVYIQKGAKATNHLSICTVREEPPEVGLILGSLWNGNEGPQTSDGCNWTSLKNESIAVAQIVFIQKSPVIFKFVSQFTKYTLWKQAEKRVSWSWFSSVTPNEYHCSSEYCYTNYETPVMILSSLFANFVLLSRILKKSSTTFLPRGGGSGVSRHPGVSFTLSPIPIIS